MTDYKVNFKDLKAKVGIDDVAYALGYRLDRKAGVGRYMELVLGDGKEKRDALVICHPQDKASQRFFRRDGSKGDVVTLIRENLNAFNVSGKDEWQKIAKVLSRFANMPEPEYREDREYVQSVRYHATFDSSRYEVKPITRTLTATTSASLIPTERMTRSGATKCEGTAVTNPRLPEVIPVLLHGWLTCQVAIRMW